jgi:hypothetical protein
MKAPACSFDPTAGAFISASRVACRPSYLLPMDVLSPLFRGRFLQKLLAAHREGRLTFFGKHVRLAERNAFAAYLAPSRKVKWHVYCKPPFGGPEAVLAYLSRYTHRVAISNHRLIANDHRGVTFRYRIIAPTVPPATRS